VIILDTHVLVWLAEDNPRMGRRAVALADGALLDDALAVTSISFWEVAMLAQKGRLELGRTASELRRRTLEQGVREIPIDGDIGIKAAQLEAFHGDPADRLIVASAIAAEATLMTADDAILRWKGKLARRDARR